MKSLIYFKPSSSSAAFEGVRLRKNLKGALELSSVPWVDSIYASPEIVHLISPDDENLVKSYKDEGAKIVVSAFYSENDPDARFLEKNSEGGFGLRKIAFKLLSESDLVLVPNVYCEDFVRAQGLKCRMEVLSAGVNLARFEGADPDEKNIFYHYFRIPLGTPYALSIGDFDDPDVKKSIEQIAFLVPGLKFYFLGVGKRGRYRSEAIAKMNKTTPSNLIYSDLVEDDVYRSAIINAKACILFDGSHPDNISALEAMAARIQIFALGKVTFPDLVVDKSNAYSFLEASELAKSLQSYCLGKLKSTIIEGYKTAQANSLIITGEKLKAYYESLL
jgi:hypothetical protein